MAVVAAGALGLVGLTGCSDDPPLPTEAAQALADGLESGDLAGAALTGATAAEASAQLSTALEGLAPLRPSVAIGASTVGEGDKSATATVALDFTWDLDASDTDWTYTTTAHLVLVEDAWQVQWSPFLIAPDLLAGETLSLRRDSVDRAAVLGAGGAVLVESRPVLRIGIDKTRIDVAGQDGAARQLATVLGLNPDDYAARVAAAGEKAFVEGLVVRAAEPGVDLAAVALVGGALQVPDNLPLAPTRRFARAILGSVGQATAELVDASGGAIAAGDVTGLSGLERQYDEQLRGRPALTVVASSADAATQRDVFALAGEVGEPLVTTIDPALQDAAETVLDAVVPASAIVAIRPSTGEVLAAASGPGSEGYSTATLGTVAPGSVFKVISSLALLRTGLMPASEVTCPTSIAVDGRTFENFPGYPASANGAITLQTAVANSCNTAFIGARDAVSQADLTSAAASLGLGLDADADLGYPAFLGTVPSDGTGTEHAASMIGQAAIQVSPLAMATVAASVARGQTVVPWLVGPTAPAVTAPATALTDEEAISLRTMMRAVVTDGGAGLLLDVPGPEVLAKTGTAQFGADGDLRNHVWMIAIQGDLAVAVYVEEGEYGSTTSGPLLKQFLTTIATP